VTRYVSGNFPFLKVKLTGFVLRELECMSVYLQSINLFRIINTKDNV
jgi:hypothetical protein